MAYTAPTEPGRTRPTTVNLAVVALYVAAGAQLINLIAEVLSYSGYKEGYQKAYSGTSLENQVTTSAASAVLLPALGALILAGGFVTLAILDGRGNRVGRIITWIFGGIALCCVAGNIAAGAFGQAQYDSLRKMNPGAPSYAQLTDALNSTLPSWFAPLSTTVTVVTIVCVLAAVVLLALPASHPYFAKKTEAQWEPPVPGSQVPYPTAPGSQVPYPTAPGSQAPYPTTTTDPASPYQPGAVPPASPEPPAPPTHPAPPPEN
jgi:hypothetical protein